MCSESSLVENLKQIHFSFEKESNRPIQIGEGTEKEGYVIEKGKEKLSEKRL